jgi:hypothetical protein
MTTAQALERRLQFQSNLPRLERERSDGARARPGSVPLPGTAEP